MEKLQKQSRIFRIIGQIGFWLAILAGTVAIAVIWLAPSGNVEIKIDNVQYNIEQLQTSHQFLLSLNVLLVVIVIAYGLYHFHRLFKLYEQGEIFGKANVRHFAGIGKAMLLWFVAKVFTSAAMIPLAEYAENGTRVELSLSSLIIGVAIILISKVMDEGRKIHEEQELTI